MNYRHAFHAGNHADVLKHFALTLWLAHLKLKPAPFAVLDAHAGPGFYDVLSDAALRSPEWESGAGRLWDWPDPPAALAPYLAALRAFNPAQTSGGALRFYPGSPALIAASLRAGDRLIACERHPEDAETLKRAFAGDRRVNVHKRDAWEALRALLPFKEGRGLVLIDPPYEAPDELETAARALAALLAHLPHLQILWWRPLKDAAALDRVDGEISNDPRRRTLRCDLAIAAPAKSGPLVASSLLAINPPHTLRAAMEEALPPLASRLAIAEGAFARVLA